MTGASGERWVVVNGVRRPLGDGDLRTVLGDLGLAPDAPGVAVAVNERVVPRGEWDRVRLEPGDRVEIVRAVQGGAS